MNKISYIDGRIDGIVYVIKMMEKFDQDGKRSLQEALNWFDNQWLTNLTTILTEVIT